jgi:AcrR family transcriptional regulator
MTKVRPDARSRILAALAGIVARDGYGNSKVQEIAREAQVSLRTFYLEFQNKEEAFLELQHQALEGLAQAVEHGVTFDSGWRNDIRNGFDICFRVLTARPRLTAAITYELVALSPEAATARAWARTRYADMLGRLVERGRASYPEIPSRPLTPLLAHGILGAILEIVTLEIADGAGADLDELVDTATDLLWSVVTNVDSRGLED